MKPKLIPEAKMIIPKWAKKIKNGNMDPEEVKDFVISISDYRFCVVGEANGFNDDYRKKCEICNKFGDDIAKSLANAKTKYSRGLGFYVYSTIKPQMVERLISRTNRFLEHFIKVHKKG